MKKPKTLRVGDIYNKFGGDFKVHRIIHRADGTSDVHMKRGGAILSQPVHEVLNSWTFVERPRIEIDDDMIARAEPFMKFINHESGWCNYSGPGEFVDYLVNGERHD